MKALGLLEVYSFTTAVTAADICAKSGGVKVIAFDRNRPKSADAPAPLVMVVKIEGDVASAKPGDVFQFMRQGYFAVDSDSTDDEIIINRTVALKDSFNPNK